jgi:hypothetical protein
VGFDEDLMVLMRFVYVVFADKIKDQVIAKIAMQASDLYADALSNMQVGSIKSMWDKVRLWGLDRCFT